MHGAVPKAAQSLESGLWVPEEDRFLAIPIVVSDRSTV